MVLQQNPNTLIRQLIKHAKLKLEYGKLVDTLMFQEKAKVN
jgi:hypothetical protein